MPRALVAAWVGSTNLGDELVHQGLRRHLADLGVDAVAASIDPQATVAVHGGEAFSHRHPADLGGLRAAVRRSDACLFGGGGLVQDQSSVWNLPFHLQRVWLARRHGLPWAGVGLGMDRLRSPVSTRMAHRLLPTARAIAVRDASSAEIARSCGVSEPILAADLALRLDTPRVQQGDIVAVCLRAPVRSGLGTAARKASNGPPETWLRAAAAAIDAVAGAHGLTVEFVALQPDRDGEVHRRLADMLGSAAVDTTPDLETVVPSIARARLVLTMRYHGAISALLGARPAVVLGYSPKMSQIVSDVGRGFRLVGQAIDTDEILSAADGALHEAAHVGDALDTLRSREMGNRRAIEAAMSP